MSASSTPRGLAIAAGVLALLGLTASPATAAKPPADAPLPAFDFVRTAWQDGREVALFIRLSPPDNSCFAAAPGPTSTVLIAAVDPNRPQGTALTVDLGPPAGVVFGEPHHDDVVPDSLGGYEDAAGSCGFVLSPSATAGDAVLSRPGHEVWGPDQWAYAVRLQPGGPYVPLTSHETILAALAAGLLDVTPIGSGGTAWTAPCENSSAGRVVRGTAGNDVLCAADAGSVLIGMGGNDILVGGPGADLLIAGPGDDIVIGGYGSDRAHGGPGDDRVYGGWGYVPGADPATRFPPPDPTMPSDGADVLTGGPGTDYLFGGYGNDRLKGSGRDRLLGGFGVDRCSPPGGDC
jgi:hypothetical protein